MKPLQFHHTGLPHEAQHRSAGGQSRIRGAGNVSHDESEPTAVEPGTWDHLWLYLLRQVIGAALVAFTYELVRRERAHPGLGRPGEEAMS